MNKQQLFNSKTDSVPPVRRDLQIIPIEENGDIYLYFHDERGYATEDFALRREINSLLSLLDGQKSINDLDPYLGNGVTKDELLQFITFLDKHRLLNSEYFQAFAEQQEAEYEQSTLHASVTAGQSYPADPSELKTYLDNAFAEYDHQETPNTIAQPQALYAPHIDPRVALESYVQAFARIRNMEPKRVVIIATSHYARLYHDTYKESPFIVVNKDFELPLGTINRDEQAIDKLRQTTIDAGITLQDRAHRMEHSIELHLLFLSYLWDHEFEIVPILTRDLNDLLYMKDGHLGQQLNKFSGLMQQHFTGDDDTFFLISGDLAHIGKKFGDQSPASTMFDDVKNFDQQFLDFGSANKRSQMLDLMKEDMDPYRICGFPPLYTFLSCMPDVQGDVISYNLWDERERESAVTFGSILYSNPAD
jgi:AmmeMemoRadiSam system protein B